MEIYGIYHDELWLNDMLEHMGQSRVGDNGDFFLMLVNNG